MPIESGGLCSVTFSQMLVSSLYAPDGNVDTVSVRGNILLCMTSNTNLAIHVLLRHSFSFNVS